MQKINIWSNEMSNRNLPVIHALWIGSKLGHISKSCLYSFIMRGHQVKLHTYGHVEDIPDGVEICDANQIITSDKIIKHNATGSYALFSDLFRYELLTKVEGIYVDCDVYCLEPLFIPDSGYLFGYEEDTKINGAILAMPKNSKLLQSLLQAAYNPQFIPPWYSDSKQRKLRIKKFLGLGTNLADMPWGVIGPDAITYYAMQTDLASYAQPIDILYPVHHRCISHLTGTGLQIEDITTSRTICIHLYNEMLRDVDFETLMPQSILYRMLKNKI